MCFLRAAYLAAAKAPKARQLEQNSKKLNHQMQAATKSNWEARLGNRDDRQPCSFTQRLKLR